MPRGSSGRDLRVRAGLRSSGHKGSKSNAALDRSLAEAQRLLQQALTQFDPSSIVVTSPNDLYKLTVASAALTRSRIELERWEAEKIGFLEESANALYAEIKIRLASRPDLIEELQNIFDAATVATKQKLLPDE